MSTSSNSLRAIFSKIWPRWRRTSHRSSSTARSDPVNVLTSFTNDHTKISSRGVGPGVAREMGRKASQASQFSPQLCQHSLRRNFSASGLLGVAPARLRAARTARACPRVSALVLRLRAGGDSTSRAQLGVTKVRSLKSHRLDMDSR
jgi:hypothetical protein